MKLFENSERVKKKCVYLQQHERVHSGERPVVHTCSPVIVNLQLRICEKKRRTIFLLRHNCSVRLTWRWRSFQCMREDDDLRREAAAQGPGGSRRHHIDSPAGSSEGSILARTEDTAPKQWVWTPYFACPQLRICGWPLAQTKIKFASFYASVGYRTLGEYIYPLFCLFSTVSQAVVPQPPYSERERSWHRKPWIVIRWQTPLRIWHAVFMHFWKFSSSRDVSFILLYDKLSNLESVY